MSKDLRARLLRGAFWFMVAGVSVIGLQATTLTEQYYPNFMICIAFVLIVVMGGVYENRRLTNRATEAEIGSMNALYMGIIWAWGGFAIAVLYTTVIEWKEWWHFVLGFGAAGIASFVFAALLHRSPDGKMLGFTHVGIARGAAWVQLVAMIVTMLGLIIDNKMDKLGWNWAVRGNPPNDWAANNVFWVGAAGLALLSIVALRYGEAAHYKDEY